MMVDKQWRLCDEDDWEEVDDDGNNVVDDGGGGNDDADYDDSDGDTCNDKCN